MYSVFMSILRSPCVYVNHGGLLSMWRGGSMLFRVCMSSMTVPVVCALTVLGFRLAQI